MKIVKTFEAFTSEVEFQPINEMLFFLIMLAQLKAFHWQTRKFAQHKAFGMTYDELQEKVDKILEVWMGKKELPPMHGHSMEMADFQSTEQVQLKIDDFVKTMDDKIRTKLDEKLDSDLLNMLDEIKADLNKLKYLLKFDK